MVNIQKDTSTSPRIMNRFMTNVNSIIMNTGFRPLSMKLSGTFDTAITTARPMNTIANPMKSSTTKRDTM